jgi:hypothetical protein
MNIPTIIFLLTTYLLSTSIICAIYIIAVYIFGHALNELTKYLYSNYLVYFII